MFVRKKKNRTGTISVVVVDKSHGFKEVKNFGVVSTEDEADILCMRAREWIHTYAGQQVMASRKPVSTIASAMPRIISSVMLP